MKEKSPFVLNTGTHTHFNNYIDNILQVAKPAANLGRRNLVPLFMTLLAFY